MLTYQEYKTIKASESKITTITKYKKYYRYKDWIIDVLWTKDEFKEEESSEFCPSIMEGYTRIKGNPKKLTECQFDYVPNVLHVSFIKDIEKYNDNIMKFIDEYVSVEY